MARTKLTAAELAAKKERLEALKRIRDSGTSQTTHQGKTVVFRSGADLNDAITKLENEIYGRRRVRRVVLGPKLS